MPDGILNSPAGYFDEDINNNYSNNVANYNPLESDNSGKPPYYSISFNMFSRNHNLVQDWVALQTKIH